MNHFTDEIQHVLFSGTSSQLVLGPSPLKRFPSKTEGAERLTRTLLHV
jgi:hypothetical protein